MRSSNFSSGSLHELCKPLKYVILIILALVSKFSLAQCPAGGITNPASVSGGNTYRITVNHTVSICHGSCVKANMRFNVCNGKKLTWSGSGSIVLTGTQVCLFDGATFSDTFFGSMSGFGGAHTVLPIILGDYFTERTTEGIRLNWVTLQEINNDYFIVQRSKDALNWDDIEQVPGAGNSNDVINYSYTDTTRSQTAYYYRIKQVDFDGENVTFDILSIDLKSYVDDELEIFPNPASSLLYINELSLPLNCEFEVFSDTGVSQEITYERTLEFSRADISLLETGSYTFQAKNNKGVIVKRFIKR